MPGGQVGHVWGQRLSKEFVALRIGPIGVCWGSS